MAQPPVTGADRKMAKHREELVRLIQFCFVGGYVALLNLDLVWLMSHQTTVPYWLYTAIIIEITICASFVLNDVLTFSKLKQGGHGRWVRLLRFHGSAALGALTQLSVGLLCHYTFGLPQVISQVIAIGVGTVVNFSMHRFWTYRKPKAKMQPVPLPQLVAVPEALD